MRVVNATEMLKRQEIFIRDHEAETWKRWYVETKGPLWSEAEAVALIRPLAPNKDETILDTGALLALDRVIGMTSV